MTSINRLKNYHLIDRLIRLILTLPVFKTTTEREFPTIRLVKTRLHYKMDDFLADNLVVYKKKEIVMDFTIDMIMDEFYSIKDHRR